MKSRASETGGPDLAGKVSARPLESPIAFFLQ